MALGDNVKNELAPPQPARPESVPMAREPYQAPRILRKRSVVDATLQVISGNCTPPNCGVGGN
jgi:hypothetical protein